MQFLALGKLLQPAVRLRATSSDAAATATAAKLMSLNRCKCFTHGADIQLQVQQMQPTEPTGAICAIKGMNGQSSWPDCSPSCYRHLLERGTTVLVCVSALQCKSAHQRNCQNSVPHRVAVEDAGQMVWKGCKLCMKAGFESSKRSIAGRKDQGVTVANAPKRGFELRYVMQLAT